MIIVEWEQGVYEFDEGGNTTYMICAVANDTLVGDRIEEWEVVFRNYTAIGRPLTNQLCMCVLRQTLMDKGGSVGGTPIM